MNNRLSCNPPLNPPQSSGGFARLLAARVLGNKAMNILEIKEPRRFPIEFEGPARDTDMFAIAIPPGYTVDDMPPAVDADYSFTSYHAKTETGK